LSESGRASFVLSAPSGAGKTSLAEHLLANVAMVQRTISCTTRAPRSHEVDGVDYFFLDPDEFEVRLRDKRFLEWADVHGHRYGTPSAEVDRIHANGDDAIMVIDVQGAESVRQKLPESITIFVLPPSRRALIERLD
jgi:guanylate kinase